MKIRHHYLSVKKGFVHMKAVIDGVILTKGKLLSGYVLLYEEAIWKIIPRNEVRVRMCTEIVDANGGFVVPGWVHVNVDCQKEGCRHWQQVLPSQGIVAFVPRDAEATASSNKGARVMTNASLDASSTLVLNRDSSTAASFMTAVCDFLKEGTYSFTECMHMLSTVPLQCLGYKDRGELQEGYVADYLVLDGETLQVKQTIISGVVVYDNTDGKRIIR